MCRVWVCSVRIFSHQVTWLNSEAIPDCILLTVTKDEGGFSWLDEVPVT